MATTFTVNFDETRVNGQLMPGKGNVISGDGSYETGADYAARHGETIKPQVVETSREDLGTGFKLDTPGNN